MTDKAQSWWVENLLRHTSYVPIPSETLSFKPPIWEYKMIAPDNVSIDMLNALGREGWEIISFNIDDNVILFKRPIDITGTSEAEPHRCIDPNTPSVLKFLLKYRYNPDDARETYHYISEGEMELKVNFCPYCGAVL
ncbi:MAG: hypothetical protein ACYTFW_03745 [Planctomycetota bacterium]